jgi:excisionase family DNA binding protein
MSSKVYTTREAAKAAKISRVTLQAWIKSGRVHAPKPTEFGGASVRLWNESDLARLRAVKQKTYLKKRGRPAKQ